MRKTLLSITCLQLFFAIGAVNAHPLDNITISHYLKLTANGVRIRVVYLLDFAEIPVMEEMEQIVDGVITPEEQQMFLKSNLSKIQNNLAFQINGAAARPSWQKHTLTLKAGEGGMNTAFLRLEGVLFLPKEKTFAVTYRDNNYPKRAGWREIVAIPEKGYYLADSSVGSVDRSHELAHYSPKDTAAAPQDVEAHFTLRGGVAPPVTPQKQAEPPAPTEPKRGTPKFGIVISAVVALGFGAWLIGRRGASR
ncbi:MAG: hypothetical protein NT023_24340 [Armatimonadetes bacterium]|nr:hypothetical protein [Armatimonadota bacterium]